MFKKKKVKFKQKAQEKQKKTWQSSRKQLTELVFLIIKLKTFMISGGLHLLWTDVYPDRCSFDM